MGDLPISASPSVALAPSLFPLHPSSLSVKPLRKTHAHSMGRLRRWGSGYMCTFAFCLSGHPTARCSQGASNFSLVLKLMSEIALAEGQGSRGVLGMLQTPHGQLSSLWKTSTKPCELNTAEETFALSGVKEAFCRPWGPGGCSRTGPGADWGPAPPTGSPRRSQYPLSISKQRERVLYWLRAPCSSPGLPCGAKFITGQLAAGLRGGPQ